jgi:hypothetical protein
MSTAINNAVEYTKGVSRKDPETVECLELLGITVSKSAGASELISYLHSLQDVSEAIMR